MITLPIKGTEMEFSREELITVLERQFANQTSQTLKLGKWFEVNPLAINQKLFEGEALVDPKQERVRQIILNAFEEMRKNPERYARKFYTMIPHPKLLIENHEILKKFVNEHKANWVNQAFEWAQRICNDESWWAVCNFTYNERWHRFVVWDMKAWLVRFEDMIQDINSVSYVNFDNLDCFWEVNRS